MSHYYRMSLVGSLREGVPHDVETTITSFFTDVPGALLDISKSGESVVVVGLMR